MLTQCESQESLQSQIESMEEEIGARLRMCEEKRLQLERHRANKPRCAQLLAGPARLTCPPWVHGRLLRLHRTGSSATASSVGS